jgi:hypothetical protein
LQERAALAEELYWARLERQKFLSLSAEADETICNLAALARKTMQERDEARNQTRMILEDVQARNARMTTMLAGQERSGAARPDVFPGAGTNSQALPPPFGPLREMTMQGQHYHIATGYCVASSSNSGQWSRPSTDAYTVRPPLHGLVTSSIQEHFDPDTFLVDAAESPQDPVSAKPRAPPV